MARFPVDNWRGKVEPHWGSDRGAADLFAPRGTAVRSVEPGVVTDAGFSAIGGNTVTVKHISGRTGYYAHLDALPDVGTGQAVTEGQRLGVVGDSGNAKGTGPHLHFGFGFGIRTGTGPGGGAGIGTDVTKFLSDLLGTDLIDPGVSEPATGAMPADTTVPPAGPPLQAQPFSGNVLKVNYTEGPFGVQLPTGIGLSTDVMDFVDDQVDLGVKTASDWVKRRLIPGILGALIAFVGGYLAGRGDAGTKILGVELIIVGISIVWFAYRDTTLVAWEAIKP